MLFAADRNMNVGRRVDLAEIHLRHALKSDPHMKEARLRLAELYAQTRRPQLAIECYQELLKDEVQFAFNIGALYTIMGEEGKVRNLDARMMKYTG